MKGIVFILSLFLAHTAYGVKKPSTRVSSFVHQVTITQDSTQSKLTQWVSPISINIPFINGAIDVRSAAMMIHEKTTNSDHSWGVLNTEIQGQWALGKVAMMSLNTSLPTGKHALPASDANIVQSIARNDLAFPVKTFGQGFDYGGALSLVRHRGYWTWSAGFGYQRKGEYEPFAGVINYKPGDEISGSIGFDYTYGAFVYRVSAAGTYFLTDRQNKTVVFQNGKQILFQGSILYTGDRFRAKAEITEMARLKNRNMSNGTLLYESRDSNGNDLRARLEASWTPSRFVTLYTTGYAKHLTANAHDPTSPLYQGEAYLVEGGGGLAFSIGSYHINVGATKLTGKAEDKSMDLSAFNVRCAFKAEF